ncbi:MAG: fumarylacetoacetate hydrolase family protein [Alphaproteobacteria bacterium]|nr:fumarylacetoacetate hydrolase family protein [Alphaproteobacteria bacterium]
MRYATVRSPRGTPVFVRIDAAGTAVPIAKAFVAVGLDPFRVMVAERRNPRRAPAIGASFPIAAVRKFYSPIIAPSKVISVGANFRNHIKETGLTIPDHPRSFGKYPSALIGHGDAIRFRRRDTKQVDYENELMIVIGRRARDVREKDALKHVFGYTVVNDVTARDHQFGGDQYSRCKSFDTFMPVGPWIVDTEDIPDPQRLPIRTRLNGVEVQNNSTADQLFGCAEIIAFLSRYTTLEPGDMITTGTPEGVAWGRKPQRFLRHGDVLESEIVGIGVLRNPVRTSR